MEKYTRGWKAQKASLTPGCSPWAVALLKKSLIFLNKDFFIKVTFNNEHVGTCGRMLWRLKAPNPKIRHAQ
jgi:hypothetical protein